MAEQHPNELPSRPPDTPNEPNEPDVVLHHTLFQREYKALADGRSFSRKRNAPDAPWEEVPADASGPPPTRFPWRLHLVVRADDPNPTPHPHHWRLYVAKSMLEHGLGSAAVGTVYQVVRAEGAAGYAHAHAESVCGFDGVVVWNFVLHRDLSSAQLVRIRKAAEAEPPPRAEDPGGVGGTPSRLWVLRVLRRLVLADVVTEETVESFEGNELHDGKGAVHLFQEK